MNEPLIKFPCRHSFIFTNEYHFCIIYINHFTQLLTPYNKQTSQLISLLWLYITTFTCSRCDALQGKSTISFSVVVHLSYCRLPIIYRLGSASKGDLTPLVLGSGYDYKSHSCASVTTQTRTRHAQYYLMMSGLQIS